MSLELRCHSCHNVLTAETEDELVDLGQQHAVGQPHAPPPRAHVLARIRRHNPPDHSRADRTWRGGSLWAPTGLTWTVAALT